MIKEHCRTEVGWGELGNEGCFWLAKLVQNVPGTEHCHTSKWLLIKAL